MRMRSAHSNRRRRAAACCGAVTVCLSWSALPARAADSADGQKAPEAPRAPVTRTPLPKIDGPYRFQPGDELEISVSPRGKDYDCRGVVLPDGMINLKTFGAIKAGKMTIEELQAVLVAKLKSKEIGLRNPSVIINPVRLAEPEKPKEIIGKVTVAGAVGRQGPLDLEDGLRVMKAIDLAGGAMKDADLKSVRLIHKDLSLELIDLSKDELVTDPKTNRILRDGDSVNVPALPVVKEVPDMVQLSGAQGALSASGQFEIGPGKQLTLQNLLTGKLSSVADFKHVTLKHAGEADKVYDLQELSDKGLSGNVPLRPGDEIYVPVQHDQVFLLGAVPRPGVYGLQAGQRISDFFIFPSSPEVAAALGQQVDIQHVKVFRQNKPAIEVNLRSVMKAREKNDVKEASAKGDLVLEPGDSILLLPKEQKTSRSPLEYLGQLGGLASLFSVF